MCRMINELTADIYRALRKSTDLGQREFGAAAGFSRSKVQRIESGEIRPSAADEAAILEAAACSRLFLADVVCKVLSQKFRVRITLDPDGPEGYRAVTPIGEVDELLRAALPKMPSHRRWAWMDRLRQVKSHFLLLEQQCTGMARDLRDELLELERKEASQPPEEEPDD